MPYVDVVDLAKQILDMDDELRYLRLENERLRECEQKYNQLLTESVKHGEYMATQLFLFAIKISNQGGP